jgi:branched-chain amino acid transport system substrate-binding protein
MRSHGRSSICLVSAGVVAAVASLAACGSSSAKTASPTTVASASTKGAAGAAGSPVRVVAIVDELPSVGLAYPTLREGFAVASKWINSHGGLGGTGHPVDVSFCVTNLNPNGSASCARQVASNPGVVATVGNVLNYSNTVDPLLEAAGVASIAPQPYSAADGSSSISFPINDAYLDTSPAMAAECIDAGHATKMSLLYVNVPAAQASLSQTVQEIEKRHVRVVNKVPVAIGTADLSPYVAKLVSGGTNGVALLTDAATAVKTVQALRSGGSKVAVCGNVDAFTPKTITALGTAGEGLYVSSLFAANSVQQPGVQAFVSAMKQYGNVGDSDDFSKQAWASLQLLNTASKGLTAITRQTVLASMKSLTQWNSGGLLPVINFKTKGTLLDGTVPRFNNPDMFYAVVKDGELTPTQGDTFSNPLAS